MVNRSVYSLQVISEYTTLWSPIANSYAASGDLRNVVKTVASLPDSYEQRMRLLVNDRDLDIVARNLILILIVFKSRDISFAVDCMIHLWYSALITEDHEKFLVEVIKPMIDEVNEKNRGKEFRILTGQNLEVWDQHSPTGSLEREMGNIASICQYATGSLWREGSCHPYFRHRGR